MFKCKCLVHARYNTVSSVTMTQLGDGFATNVCNGLDYQLVNANTYTHRAKTRDTLFLFTHMCSGHVGRIYCCIFKHCILLHGKELSKASEEKNANICNQCLPYVLQSSLHPNLTVARCGYICIVLIQCVIQHETVKYTLCVL